MTPTPPGYLTRFIACNNRLEAGKTASPFDTMGVTAAADGAQVLFVAFVVCVRSAPDGSGDGCGAGGIGGDRVAGRVEAEVAEWLSGASNDV